MSTITKAAGTQAAPLLASYDFTGVSSTIVPDQTGNGYAGVIRGCDRGGAAMGVFRSDWTGSRTASAGPFTPCGVRTCIHNRLTPSGQVFSRPA